ncbi:MAG: FAD-dependent oxidoreductase [Desulfobacterales bacterium]|jgi:heterodisulfide reductase subunit A|nr:FAD-dependent oxidoreductase [Desulfobacterales bacterium]
MNPYRKAGTAMVVGAGISGIRAALDLAEFGYGVTLIDRAAHLGGILSQLDYQFPSNHCGMCKMLPLVNRNAASQHCLRKGLSHENIEILLSTELVAVSGEPGNFQVTLREKARGIDPAKCMGCGLCTEVCPVAVPDTFNAGLTLRKAVFLPAPLILPHTYQIDAAACTGCGQCVPVCPTGAIQLQALDRQRFRILVVDDELIVRESLKAWLQEEEGFSVISVASGAEALACLAEGPPIHLMLTDIKMPGMDGVELLQKARELFPELTVILMTAYATVETAVEAMKIGASDYLIKPFEPDKLIPMVTGVYHEFEMARARRVTVGAVVLCGGTAFFDPSTGINTFGYGVYPNVVTSLAFERMLSGTGPSRGCPVRPSDGKPVSRAAWIQCVGSRDLQLDADFCSGVCCMHAIKEAVMAKQKAAGNFEAAIFYMDMRTAGKSFQRYRESAEALYGVRFERVRIHSVAPAAKGSGDLLLRYADENGALHETRWDMVILSVGQRPAPGIEALAEMTGIGRNRWGFAETEAFSLSRTGREGIFIGGAFSGLTDIQDAVIQASAAALGASRILHGAGGSLALEAPAGPEERDVAKEPPRILAVLCTCGGKCLSKADVAAIAPRLLLDPAVQQVEGIEQLCGQDGGGQVARLLKDAGANRLLIGACTPYAHHAGLRELARETGLSADLMTVADFRPPFLMSETTQPAVSIAALLHTMETGIAALKRVTPGPVAGGDIEQSALVVGGGIAGMHAAIGLADHGFQVALVEKSDSLGGNMKWLHHTLDGHAVAPLLQETLARVQAHPHITVQTGTRVMGAFGQVGQFVTTLEGPEGVVQTQHHGVTILATGGTEAATTAYGYGTSAFILTQKELETALRTQQLDPAQLRSVVMIQCVDSREEPRNYCSRICCPTALKHALRLKEMQPDIVVTILYRDIMTPGFTETYYTQARKTGILFIRYDGDHKPRVEPLADGVQITVREPILERDVQIMADRLILATGIVPTLSPELAQAFGIDRDQDGFFQEAEPKWRPVDALKEGVFACGLALSPRNITESIASAEAAAQRALRLLARKHLPAGKVTSMVRHSLCSLCERCIEACPYGARTLDEDPAQVQVNPLMCQGCGACVSACPNGASVLEGFFKTQMLEIIDSACW